MYIDKTSISLKEKIVSVVVFEKNVIHVVVWWTIEKSVAHFQNYASFHKTMKATQPAEIVIMTAV